MKYEVFGNKYPFDAAHCTDALAVLVLCPCDRSYFVFVPAWFLYECMEIWMTGLKSSGCSCAHPVCMCRVLMHVLHLFVHALLCTFLSFFFVCVCVRAEFHALHIFVYMYECVHICAPVCVCMCVMSWVLTCAFQHISCFFSGECASCPCNP